MKKTNAWMRFLAIGAVIPALLVAGCQKDDNPASAGSNSPTVEDLQSVTDDFSSTLASPEEGMLPLWENMDFGGRVLKNSGGTSSIADTVIRERNGLTVTRIRTFFDSEGNSYDRFVPDTTVSLMRILNVEGTHSSPLGNRTATIAHHDTMTVTGIGREDSVRVMNGTGDRSVEAEFEGRMNQMSMSMSNSYVWTVTDLTIHRNRDLYPYPLSGTMEVSADMQRSGTTPRGSREVHRTFSFTVTFDGSQYALVELPGGVQYYIDLAEGVPHDRRPGPGGGN